MTQDDVEVRICTQYWFSNEAILVDILELYTDDISSCAGVEGQWRRIASIDISVEDKCPMGWNKSSHNGVGTPSDDGGCYSTFFSTNGVSYQHVCGKVRGYQKSTPNAFRRNTLSIDTYYIDGLSITHSNLRQHSVQSMPILGGLGACPPGYFEKLHSLRLNLRVFL